MSKQFSQASRLKLETCDQQLQDLFYEVLQHWDCTIICGTRTQLEQERAFKDGKSKVNWPDSKHNTFPSKAVDVAPFYPGEGIPWNDKERFRLFGGFVLGTAVSMGIKIRYGGDWDGDWVLTDQTLIDLPHFELVED